MIKIPNYTIERDLGQGGMAKVYLAKQDMLHRYVALKVMFQELAQDKNFRKSFLSEGSTIANLEHTNIVRIHDIGITDDSVFYMAMEYLSGGSLKDKLEQSKLSYSKVVSILQEAAGGLAYAHEKGYIHRDIKPGNILFRENGVAVLTDFGIAKLQDTTGELTRMGYTMGTVQYMSPEQAITTDLDQRSDIYSLGLVFYEMLTGSKAFLAESTIQAIHQHTTVPPPLLPDEYAFLQPVLDKVLAKEPDDRFQTVSDFIKAVKESDQADKTVIRRVNHNEDLEATRVYSPNNIPAKSKKKSNLKTVITGLILLLVVGGLGVSKYIGLLDGSGNSNGIVKPELIDRVGDKNTDQQEMAKQRIREIEEAKTKEIALQKEAMINARIEEKRKSKKLAEERKREEERVRQAELAKAKIAEKIAEEEKVREKELVKQQAEKEERIKNEALAKQQAKDAEKEKNKELAKQQLEQERLKKEREKKAIARKKVKDELDKKKAKQKKIAKEKARIEAKKKKAADKKKKAAKALATKRAAQAKTLAKKRAEAARRQQQYGQNFIQASVTLNGKPYKATIRVTKNGRQVKLIRNQSFAKIQLPSGRYTVSTQYGGKSSSQVVNLEGNEISQLRFAFRGSAPVPSNSKWTHTHQPPPQNKPRTQPKPAPKKESKADRMVKEVEELWFDR